MVEELPSAVFSKPQGEIAYRIVYQHRAFESPDLSRVFQRVCNGFEWKPTSSDRQHAPCHGIVSVENRFLLAKFRDIGRDAAGRPHTLRVDCLLTDAEHLESAWKSFTQRETPPPIPAEHELTIVGDTDSFWSARS
jgi:hypothetical protein